MDDIMGWRMWIASGALLVAVAFVTLAIHAPLQAQQADTGSAALAELLKSLTVPGGKAGSGRNNDRVVVSIDSNAMACRVRSLPRRQFPPRRSSRAARDVGRR